MCNMQPNNLSCSGRWVRIPDSSLNSETGKLSRHYIADTCIPILIQFEINSLHQEHYVNRRTDGQTDTQMS